MRSLLRIMLLFAIFTSPLAAESGIAEWHFSVLLDGKAIGTHRYSVTTSNGLIEVQSQAEMRVRFMFFDAYRYQHQATELWQHGCLLSIDAETDDNNKPLLVQGRRDEGLFRIAASAVETTELPACVKSFAYWDLAILQTDKLLNAQTGELTAVTVIPGSQEVITAAGQQWQAQHYTLTGEKLHIELWYGPQGEWLRLRSRLASGRELDYQLEQGPGIVHSLQVAVVDRNQVTQ
jgi:hypothetical protein